MRRQGGKKRSTLPETINMFDYLVFEFPFLGTILEVFVVRISLFARHFFHGFGFRYSNVMFGGTFLACSIFDFFY